MPTPFLNRNDETVANLYHRDIISTMNFKRILLEFYAAGRRVDGILALLDYSQLRRIMDTLHEYPHTDLAWESLPESRSELLKHCTTEEEGRDFIARHYQEDRPHVEYLRSAIIEAAPETDRVSLGWGRLEC
jgi:hypothetical protein